VPSTAVVEGRDVLEGWRWRVRRASSIGACLAARLACATFVRERPNQLWLTDVTEHRHGRGRWYCAVVLDAFSRRVVGWSISHNPTAALTCNAIRMAIERREATRGETVIHSDHATQFTSWAPRHPVDEIIRRYDTWNPAALA